MDIFSPPSTSPHLPLPFSPPSMPPVSSSSSSLLSSQRSRRTKNTSSSDSQAILHRMKSQQGPKKSSNGSATRSEKAVTYGECQKNHAASIGGYAVDGCREFMAAGAEGTADALRCAACGCHRSFHKRKVEPEPACDCSSDSTSSWR